MARPLSIADSLAKAFDDSPRAIYCVDAQRRIVYCNLALAEWMDLERKRIIGRRIEYHSEDPKAESGERIDAAPLTDLCPPPYSLAGEPGKGTISCQARDGRMLYRAAEFIPLSGNSGSRRVKESDSPQQSSVLVLLAAENLTSQDLATEVAADLTSDELHRTIRQFRRAEAERYSIKALLGTSQAMQKVRAQVQAAAASSANTLIFGRPGSGRRNVARAIHYQANGDEASLLPLNCQLLSEDLVAHTLDRLAPTKVRGGATPTLLLENVERMVAKFQAVLVDAIRQNRVNARIIATADLSKHQSSDAEEPTEQPEPQSAASDSERSLLTFISTITIRIPRLVDRPEDLPVLAQYFLEVCNRASSKQVGSIRPEAVDALALYSWPGELDQLHKMIELAHAACTSHAIAASDLPPIFHQAFQSNARKRHQLEPINLDELLASIEREAITRALAQTGGNKSEAATLLGMTRPRFYRRLVQLGFVTGELDSAVFIEEPEFIEHDESE